MTALSGIAVAVELALYATAELIADGSILATVLVRFTGVCWVRERFRFPRFTTAGPHGAHDHHNSKQ